MTNVTLHNRDEIARLGPARRRPDRAAARGRRDPASGRQPDARGAARGLRVPRSLPGLRERGGGRGRRGRRALHRRAGVPGAAVRAAAPLRQPRRARHRGAGREVDPRIHGAWLANPRAGRHFPPAQAPQRPRRARGLAGQVGGQPAGFDRGQAPPRRRAAAVRARHPPRRRGHRARPAEAVPYAAWRCATRPSGRMPAISSPRPS